MSAAALPQAPNSQLTNQHDLLLNCTVMCEPVQPVRSGLNVGMDLAVDTGIFDFANVGYMSNLPALTPTDMKTRGSASWLNCCDNRQAEGK